MDIKEKINNSPKEAGIYLFKDKDGAVVYIGKAASIRERLRSHFVRISSQKEAALIANAADIDYIITPDEASALLLEAALVKKYLPRYNAALRDDKSYPRLKLTINEEYPRLIITRKIKPDGALYFGPYTNAKLLRKAVSFMKRAFPLRTCKTLGSQACLDFHIGQCIAPCIDKSKKDEYLEIAQELKMFLSGERDGLLNLLKKEMEAASNKKEFEKAARIRDRINALSFVSSVSKRVQFYPTQQLEELKLMLELARTPYKIEAFDVSNITGKEAVGSLVCFKDGRPDKDNYRKFKIRTVKTIDDYSMMREIIARHYKKTLWEKLPLPDLVIIDGGKGHLMAAKNQMRRMKLWNIPVVSIAKGIERVYISENKEPILIGKFEAAHLLLKRIRDEAHRFAIGYHRLLRRKAQSISELDEIDGIGPKRRALLIKHFGSVDEIKMAGIEDLKKVKSINEKEAKAIYDHFR